MSLFKRLFKPAWQSSDSNRRATAVQSLKDPDLLGALPTIATQDDSAAVRRAAIWRMNDLGLFADRSRHDADERLRADARKRFVQGLVEADDARQGEAERLLRVEEDPSVLESVARNAGRAALRRIALEKLQRPGLLADCALSDPDGEIRLWLVSRIDTESALKRVMEQSRKTDKRVYRAASALLEQRAMENGDGQAKRQHSLDLCTRMEGLLHELPTDVAQQLSAIEADWNGLKTDVDEAMQRRVEGLIKALHGALEAIDGKTVEVVSEALDQPSESEPVPEEDPAPTAAEPAEPAAAEAPAEVQDPRLAEIIEQIEQAAEDGRADLAPVSAALEALAEDELLAQSVDKLRRWLDRIEQARRSRAREAMFEQASALIAQLEKAVVAQQAAEARAAIDQLEVIKQAHQGLPRALRPGYAEAKAEARKLLDWQRWSNNEIRRRLCDDLEALPEAGLHPDAVAARVKELQAEWRRIDALEGIDPKSPARGLGKRFNALVFQVLKPARPYFEKRAELRRERGEALEQSASNIEAQLAEARDRKAIMALRRTLVDGLRELNEIDPRQRKSMGQRLRADLLAVDTRLAEQSEQVELGKRRLIAELRRDLAALPVEEHAERAKQAQSRWRSLGSGDRKRDQAQWKELRELVDPVFTALAGQREVEQAENQAQIESFNRLLKRLEDACSDDQIGAEGLQRLQQQCREEIAELGPLDRQRERRIDEAMRQVDQRYGQRLRHQRLSAYTALATRASRLDRIEAAWIDGSGLDQPGLHDLIDAEPLSDTALQAALEIRRGRLQAVSGEADEADMAQVLNLLEAQQREAEAVLLDCEFFAGVDSPAEFQSERMDLQVKRLAERMAGGEVTDAARHAARLWAAWFSVGPLSATSRASLAARFDRCRKALEGALN
ncbi:MAG: DUF349 domain-containing protein [Xanthomonadales bacterium]|nr:DUF349 domain-containing protein [Xanthomonadales bacterium]